MNEGPLFIVDSDVDDQDFIRIAWEELYYGNPMYFFSTAEEMLQVMEDQSLVPFLIICELNLPTMSGLELKRTLMKTKSDHYRSIPFVFLSQTISEKYIREAYDLCSNGIFEKRNSIKELKNQLIHIAQYWRDSLVPAPDHAQ